MGNIIFGLIFIVGGLTGYLALIGTNSGRALAVVGALLVARGVYVLRKQKAQQRGSAAGAGTGSR